MKRCILINTSPYNPISWPNSLASQKKIPNYILFRVWGGPSESDDWQEGGLYTVAHLLPSRHRSDRQETSVLYTFRRQSTHDNAQQQWARAFVAQEKDNTHDSRGLCFPEHIQITVPVNIGDADASLTIEDGSTTLTVLSVHEEATLICAYAGVIPLLREGVANA